MTRLIITLMAFGFYLSASAQCQADFTYSATNGTVTFTNTSTGGGLFNSWTFGDGGTSYQSNPSHTYTSTGNYVVCLSIFDSLSQCQDSYCDTIFVQADTTGGGTGCNVTSNAYANANGTIIGTASGASMYNWAVYDNSWNYLYDVNSGNLNYNPGANGNYNVCLTAYDSLQNFCDSTCYTVTVIDSTGGGTGCNLTSNATTNGSSIVGSASGTSMYHWIVYDNSWNFLYDTNNSNFTYSPGFSGLFNVCITAYDSQQNVCDSTCYMMQLIDSTGGNNCLISSSASIDQSGNIVGSASGASMYHWIVYDNSWNFLHDTNNSNLMYTPNNPGTFNVCLTAYDSLQNICDSMCYTLVSDSLAGFSFEEEEIVFNIYPNPTQGVIHLEVSNDQIAEIVLIDITGAVLLQESITESTTEIDLSLYPKGMYFIHALGRKGQRLSTGKVLRQ